MTQRLDASNQFLTTEGLMNPIGTTEFIASQGPVALNVGENRIPWISGAQISVGKTAGVLYVSTK